MKLRDCVFLVMILVVPQIVYGQTWQEYYGQLSAKLDEGMTEDAVKKLVNYEPNKVELKTCGQQSGSGAWQCKIYTWGDDVIGPGLVVLFSKSAGKWHVNSWEVKTP